MSIVTEEKGETSPMRGYQIPSAEAKAPELRSSLTSISVMDDDEVPTRAHRICKAVMSRWTAGGTDCCYYWRHPG